MSLPGGDLPCSVWQGWLVDFVQEGATIDPNPRNNTHGEEFELNGANRHLSKICTVRCSEKNWDIVISSGKSLRSVPRAQIRNLQCEPTPHTLAFHLTSSNER